eukprot:scaffold570_cov234-Pinguiococcus_pyrenoidosus.AAC.9
MCKEVGTELGVEAERERERSTLCKNHDRARQRSDAYPHRKPSSWTWDRNEESGTLHKANVIDDFDLRAWLICVPITTRANPEKHSIASANTVPVHGSVQEAMAIVIPFSGLNSDALCTWKEAAKSVGGVWNAQVEP